MTPLNVVLIIFYTLLLSVLTFLTLKKTLQLSLPKILLLATLLRVLICLSFIPMGGYDTMSYSLIGNLILHGKTIYPAYAYYHYPYLPGFDYVEALAVFFGRFGFPFMLFLKLFISSFDIGAVWLIYLLSKKNTQIALLYAVNPATIFVAAAHGQLEALPIFFSLLALYLAQRKKEAWASLALGLAITAKVWPLILLPFFLKYAKRWYLNMLALAVPACSVITYAVLFHTPILEVLHPPLSYRGSYGWFGVSIPVHFFLPADIGSNNAITKSVTNATILLLSVVILRSHKTTLGHELFVYLLLFGAFVLTGANPLWLLPLLLLFQPSWWIMWFMTLNILMAVEEIAETIYMITPAFTNQFTAVILLISFCLWIINLIMVVDLFRRTSSAGSFFLDKDVEEPCQ